MSIGSALKVVSFVLLFIAGANVMLNNSAIRSFGRVGLAWLAYVLYVAMSMLWSNHPDEAFRTSVSLLQLTLLSFVLVQFVPDRSDGKRVEIAWHFVAAACLALLFTAGQQAQYGQRTELVLASGASDGNEFSAYFLVSFTLAITYLYRTRSWLARLLLLVAALVIIYGILLTGSRGGLLAILASALASLAVLVSKSPSRIAVAVFAGVFMVYISLDVILPLVPSSVVERLQIESVVSDQGSGRLDIWQSALEQTSSSNWHFFFGFGPLGLPEGREVIHNHFLQSYVDGGVLGLTIFLWFIAEVLIASYRSGPAYFGASVGAVILLASLTAYAYFKPVWAIFMMSLLVSSTHRPRSLRIPTRVAQV